MQRATTPMNRLLVAAAVVILAATTIPVVSGFGTDTNRTAMPHACPPVC